MTNADDIDHGHRGLSPRMDLEEAIDAGVCAMCFARPAMTDDAVCAICDARVRKQEEAEAEDAKPAHRHQGATEMTKYRSLYAIERALEQLDGMKNTVDYAAENFVERVRDILAKPDEPAPDTRYNGWTNYETWRVNLELLSDYCDSLERDRQTFASAYELADHLKEYTEEVVSGEMTGETGNQLAIDYALSFVSDVNYDEIAGHWPELIESDDEDDEGDDEDDDLEAADERARELMDQGIDRDTAVLIALDGDA